MCISTSTFTPAATSISLLRLLPSHTCTHTHTSHHTHTHTHTHSLRACGDTQILGTAIHYQRRARPRVSAARFRENSDHGKVSQRDTRVRTAGQCLVPLFSCLDSVCMHVRVYMYVYVRIVSVYMYVCLCMCVCLTTCVYAYVCVYVNLFLRKSSDRGYSSDPVVRVSV